jgi:hypothetical protein
MPGSRILTASFFPPLLDELAGQVASGHYILEEPAQPADLLPETDQTEVPVALDGQDEPLSLFQAEPATDICREDQPASVTQLDRVAVVGLLRMVGH